MALILPFLYKFPAPYVESFDDCTLNFDALQTTLSLPAWTAPTLDQLWANAWRAV